MLLSSFRVLLVIFYWLAKGQFGSTTTQIRKIPSDCRNVSEVVFLTFYPCFMEASSRSELGLLEQCDLLTIAAITLASERVNGDASILPAGSTLRVLPIEDRQTKISDAVFDDDRMILVRSTGR